MSLYEQFIFSVHYLSWYDCIEIAAFSMIIYFFSLWLRNDHQKNLLLYFYGYCTAIMASHVLHLPSLHIFLVIAFPLFLLFLVLIHQELLQKNFIALRNVVQPTTMLANNWLETLLSSCLVATHNNKEIMCIIEHKDSVSDVLKTELSLFADLQKNILDMLLHCTNYDQSKMLWVTSSGRLQGINASWQNYNDQWITPEIRSIDKWQQDALFFTAKTDAIVFRITTHDNTFCIVVQGKIFNNINSTHAYSMLKKYLCSSEHQKGEILYAQNTKKTTTFKQSSS